LVEWRGIKPKALEAYHATILCDVEGEPFATHYKWPENEIQIKYHDPANSRAYQVFNPNKTGSLFGQDLFDKGERIAITITEGAADAIAAYQMLEHKYPCVAVHSASTAKTDCKAQFDYINSFDKIYLALDNDQQGQAATAAIAKLFDLKKIYYVDLDGYKDAHEFLEAEKEYLFRNRWWGAEVYKPKGIINGFAEVEAALKGTSTEQIAEYPFPSLNKMTYGISNGEFILVTAETGVGKTEITRALEYHVLSTTEVPLASIRIEESEKRSIEGMVGYHLKTPLHLPTSTATPEEVLAEYKKMLGGKEDRLFFYSHYGSDNPEVFLDAIRYLVTVKDCRVVVLDHISMIVSGAYQEDERKTLDYLATQLATMVNDLDFSLICISHVNDDGKTRGSRNISQVANTWIHLHRDSTDEQDDELIRNATRVNVRKNRDGAVTGAAGILFFDIDTFTVTEDYAKLVEYQQHMRAQEVPF
jgi:twinkle protein